MGESENKVVSMYVVEVSWPTEPMMLSAPKRRNTGHVNLMADQSEIPWLIDVLGKDGLTVDRLQRIDAFASINDAAEEFFDMKIVAAIQQPSKVGDTSEPDKVVPTSSLPTHTEAEGEGV